MKLRLALIPLLLASPSFGQDIITGDAMEGAEIFATYCAACHGDEGRGDGRMGPVLSIQPPDLTALAASNDGVFPVETTVFQIDGRDPLLAHGAEMPIFGMFFQGMDAAIKSESGQPIITSRQIADVVAFLQEIQE